MGYCTLLVFTVGPRQSTSDLQVCMARVPRSQIATRLICSGTCGCACGREAIANRRRRWPRSDGSRVSARRRGLEEAWGCWPLIALSSSQVLLCHGSTEVLPSTMYCEHYTGNGEGRLSGVTGMPSLCAATARPHSKGPGWPHTVLAHQFGVEKDGHATAGLRPTPLVALPVRRLSSGLGHSCPRLVSLRSSRGPRMKLAAPIIARSL